MWSRIYSAGWKAVDWLFPPGCAGCGKWGTHLCPSCWSQIKPLEGPLCQICGEPLKPGAGSTCSRCQKSSIYFTAVRSWAGLDGPIQQAIRRLKYKRDLGLGEVLAKPLCNLLQSLAWKIDLVTVVPLDKIRKLERGYNQCYFLAKQLAWETGLDFQPSAIMKVRATRPQVGLSLEERKDNLDGAFLANSDFVKEKTVLIIDDVMTTGSTLNSCAAALKAGRAAAVYGLTLARSSKL